ncbi:MAG: 50S ribosomal protein L29 [Anaerolineales bacterium]|nr:50S ribosomal protein L29 [Anaerolineales bacterium]
MKMKEIRGLSIDELRSKLMDAKEELMRLRFQQATGELTDTSRLRQTRHNIARINTILTEREQNPDSEVSNE